MTTLIEITAREANHRISELLREVEARGHGHLVTKHGRPVAFPGTTPHRYRNSGPGATRVVWAITPPSF